ncbi:MAG: DUF4345 domain-containing protein [Thalassolituus sp.]
MNNILRWMLIVIGLVALITGVNVILGGSASVPGASSAASAVHDNEMRFFAVYWVGFGIFSFWVSRDLESRMGFIPALAAFFFLGGVARLVSIMLVGFPSAPLIGSNKQDSLNKKKHLGFFALNFTVKIFHRGVGSRCRNLLFLYE